MVERGPSSESESTLKLARKAIEEIDRRAKKTRGFVKEAAKARARAGEIDNTVKFIFKRRDSEIVYERLDSAFSPIPYPETFRKITVKEWGEIILEIGASIANFDGNLLAGIWLKEDGQVFTNTPETLSMISAKLPFNK